MTSFFSFGQDQVVKFRDINTYQIKKKIFQTKLPDVSWMNIHFTNEPLPFNSSIVFQESFSLILIRQPARQLNKIPRA